MNIKSLTNEEGLKNFDETGVLIIESIIDPKKCDEYRDACNKYLGVPTRGDKVLQSMVDGPTKHKEFWDLINNKKVLSYVKRIISGPVLYTQHSDLHINLGTGAFHRDSREKRFDPKYASSDETVLRLAIYLSDTSGNRGGLLVIPNSHKKQSYLQNKELSFYNRVRKKFRNFNLNELMPQFSFLSKSVRIFPKSGSVIIFDQRVVHAGMSPPKKIGNKYSIFWSYGSKSDGSKAHVDFYRSKKGYLKSVPDQLKDLLSHSGVQVY